MDTVKLGDVDMKVATMALRALTESVWRFAAVIDRCAPLHEDAAFGRLMHDGGSQAENVAHNAIIALESLLGLDIANREDDTGSPFEKAFNTLKEEPSVNAPLSSLLS